MKTWLRTGGQVEIIGNEGWYWRSGHFSQRPERVMFPGRRSVIRELLTEEEADLFELSPGVWLLPGTPP